MRLRKLDIVGFKSFADRARLIFGDGITGVVGPNGCGKSNIVDAMRWCMGEMSAKNLRGRGMQDVIFAGADTRGPLGMAEVTLTFENDGNVPPTYANYTEIAVTRRLYRDGTSEYLINRTPVRLRDITDLFLGTGVGTRAYSIIEQGRIGFVVNARPEDRRSLIEEVAGITKFKTRKKAAERRMEATEQNLKRVEDIISELSRQLGSLRRQARRAERYKQVKAELRDLELRMAAMEILRLTAEQKVHLAAEQEVSQRIDDAQRGLVADESGLEADRLSLTALEQRLQEEQQAGAEVDARLAALERDLEHWRRELAEARQRSEENAALVADATLRIEAVQRERSDLESQVAAAQHDTQSGREQIANAEADLVEVQGEQRALDDEIEALRQDALAFVRAATEQRALAQSLDRRRVDLRIGLEEATCEREELSLKRAGAEQARVRLAVRRDGALQELADWQERHGALRMQLHQTNLDVAASGDRIGALRDQLAERRSRLGSLQQVARRLEGCSDGVRDLMGASAEQDEAGAPKPAVAGIRALVAEILHVPKAYEHAIEAVLGERLQYLVVDDHRSAIQAIDHLRARDSGRSGFVPIDARGATAPSAGKYAGLLVAARDVVDVDAAYARVADALLGDVWIVDTIDSALQLWTQAPACEAVLVTQDGGVLHKTGVVAGGAGGSGAGLLASRREIRELSGMVAAQEEELFLAKAQHEDLQRTRMQQEVDIQQLEKDIHAAELEKIEVLKDLEATERELRNIDERLSQLDRDVSRRAEELAVTDDEEQAAVEAAEKAEADKLDAEDRLAVATERRQVRAAQLAAQTDELTAMKVQLAARDEKLVAAKESITRACRTLAELESRIARGKVTIEQSAQRVTELEQSIRDGDRQALAAADEARARRDGLSVARVRYDAERQRIAELEQGMRAKRRGGEAMQEALVNTRMSLQRLAMQRDQILNRITERHDIDLLRIVGDYHMAPLPGDAELSRQQELERAIKAMGPINLTAIEECAQLEGRHSFLVAQRDDLTSALSSLKRAISRINRASRERFKEAFEAVNEMFQKVYPRLFRGGEARLELVNADDLLEAGVDIFAQPPGKKLQSVGLLSGGEKALTATALVFSIFLIKPSPFCILDEVDAPLDDANVGRFNDMLREISKLSQFVVITHNKTTMTEADRLYGITMEEPGMSKVVSVDLEGLEQERAA